MKSNTGVYNWFIINTKVTSNMTMSVYDHTATVLTSINVGCNSIVEMRSTTRLRSWCKIVQHVCIPALEHH